MRSALAVKHIRDGSRVLEIGTEVGMFRQLVANRCRYTGADLQPIDLQTIALDIESDPILPGPLEIIVLFGVFKCLYDPLHALMKVCAEAKSVVFTYCIPHGPNLQERTVAHVDG
jgi:hypothetical protein